MDKYGNVKLQNLLKVFTQTKDTEIFTAKVKEAEKEFIPHVLYRCCRFSSTHLCFLLYDFKDLYFSQAEFSKVQELNKELNHSLEFNDINSLLNFLFDHVIRKDRDLTLTREGNKFEFEVLVDIIKVKWVFNCHKLPIDAIYEIIQELFIKPMLNVMLSFQNFLSNERVTNNNQINKVEIHVNDVKSLTDNLEVNKLRNFNKNMAYLLSESTTRLASHRFNEIQKKKHGHFENFNGKSESHNSNSHNSNYPNGGNSKYQEGHANSNLKRKNNQTMYSGSKSDSDKKKNDSDKKKNDSDKKKNDSDKKKNDKEENLNKKKKKTTNLTTGSSKDEKTKKSQKSEKPQHKPEALPRMFQRIPVDQLEDIQEKSLKTKNSQFMQRDLPKEFQSIQMGNLGDLSDDEAFFGGDKFNQVDQVDQVDIANNQISEKPILVEKNKNEKKKKMKMSFV